MRVAIASLLLVCAVALPRGASAQQPPPTPAPTAVAAANAGDTPPERVEPGLADRKQRYARPAWQQVAMVPSYILRAPFWLLQVPLEASIHKDPGPVTVYGRKALRNLHQVGIGIRVGGLGSGSGTGGGILYELPHRFTAGYPVRFSASTTYRGYDLVTGSVDSLNWGPGRSSLRFQYSEKPQEDFFGTGPSSALDDRATYQVDDTRLGLVSVVRLSHAWQLQFEVAGTRDVVGRGRDSKYPTVLEVFDPSQYEGLSGRFEFLDYGVGFAHDTRDVPTYARHGHYFNVRVQAADGLRDTPHAYTKFGFEAMQFVPLPLHRTGLAAHVRAVLTDDRSENGEDVPIFRLERVGGSRSVRGYQTYRFTDHDALYSNLEYRFPVWDLGLASQMGIDGALFWDCGTAVRNLEDVHGHDFHSSAGFGFRMVSARGLIGRSDFAWTADEGFRLHATLTGTF